jgi:hypothetical protein
VRRVTFAPTLTEVRHFVPVSIPELGVGRFNSGGVDDMRPQTPARRRDAAPDDAPPMMPRRTPDSP